MELFLQDDTLITSKTDTSGRLLYGNEDFCHFGGFKDEKEFINKPHNIIRHPSMQGLLSNFYGIRLRVERNFLLLHATDL